MSFFQRLRSRLSAPADPEAATSALAEAERQLRWGASVSDIRLPVREISGGNRIESAWIALFLGELDAALEFAYAAATERPYDVDSRIVHGTVRLARNELDHAEHEFDAVIEEFGADPDAADGRRATILARGQAPLDELPASDEEWDSAAVLLTTLWRVAGVVENRLTGMQDTHADGRLVIMQALSKGQAADREAERGTV
ncbi:MAG: hypothetical protein F4Y04_02155 [Chloroflexi bacterium]|nr:hypothetical protein [Chloroflexota bacterium]